MKIKEYLIDNRYLILFYVILMSFISLVIYLDNKVIVNVNNLIYINIVALIFFLIYLLGKYLFNRRFYNTINDIVENQREDIINILPEAKKYEQNLYIELIRNIYREQNEKIEKLYVDKKENLEFVTSWVHEIKTPISVSRLIIQNSTDKSKEEMLDSLEEEIDKIDNYVEQSLYYSKIDEFSKDYFIKEIELDKIIKEIVKKNAKTFINKRIKIDIENVDLSVTTDRKWLTFILNQILSNSLKYTSKEGTIKIFALKDEKGKTLIIEDNGIGIKEEDIRRVFDKGFTGYNGRENNYKSTGMGLYLAKRLAIKLGHDITIESIYGKYTKVLIYFPKLNDYFNVIKR